jgi:hypothetical protein
METSPYHGPLFRVRVTFRWNQAQYATTIHLHPSSKIQACTYNSLFNSQNAVEVIPVEPVHFTFLHLWQSSNDSNKSKIPTHLRRDLLQIHEHLLLLPKKLQFYDTNQHLSHAVFEPL